MADDTEPTTGTETETDLLVYGSYGYTGSLIVRRAVEEGLSPALAGRRAEPTETQASSFGLEHDVFSLEHPRVIEERVGEFDAVLNCAGPFSRTADPLVSACLEAGTDYLDITGEVDVLESIAARDREAERAGVTLLPGVGFDVVPTDCLAAHLETRLPSATHLAIAIDGLGTFSPGTLKSIVEGFSRPGLVREDGALREVPSAWKTRWIDFGPGAGTKPAVTVPWGDVSTAYYATGVPNVETYAAVPEFAADVMRRTRGVSSLLGTRPAQRAIETAIGALVSGPTAEERADSVSRVWAEATDGDGERVAARLHTPDTYDLTAATATESARRVDDVGAGFQTPASAFGPDYVLEFDGCEREAVDPGASIPVDD